jgi:SAM-dependent methyltransferase
MVFRELKKAVSLSLLKAKNRFKEKFTCSICGYHGTFDDILRAGKPVRYNVRCPKCNSFARHRLLRLAIDRLAEEHDFEKMKMLHFAPEECFRDYFRGLFMEYVSADLTRKDVDHNVDLTNLPWQNSQYDFICACHVLEHIKDDVAAIAQARRVLRPGGIAVFVVPINSEKTIEYPEPNAFESDHVRSPGLDYYDRLTEYFHHMETLSSSDFPSEYQTFACVDWSNFPTKESPLRQPLKGDKHPNIVAICYA